jgi:hypothetical protein
VSAAGRGEHRGGDVDFYPTPAWCVDRLLDDCGLELFSTPPNQQPPYPIRALEPTAGDGAIVRAFDAWCTRKGCDVERCEWTAVELRHGAIDSRTRLAHRVEGVDFRSWEPAHRFDTCIGNPPFEIAESIVRRALGVADVVVMLLRVSFLESEERVAFWRGVGSDVALRILPQRPSFDGEGTDSCAYAWFVWNCPAVTGVRVLDATPKGVRSAQKPGSLQFDPRQIALFAGGER